MRNIIVFAVISLLFLGGCNTETTSGTGGEKPSLITNITSARYEFDEFSVEINSAKEVYEQGEPVDVTVTLYNKTEQTIDIGHAGSWVGLATTDLTRNYQYGYAMIEPYLVTTIKPGETILETYRFSGVSYSDDMPGNPYKNKDMEQMATLKFPKGQYKIIAYVDFGIDKTDRKFSTQLPIVFEVK